MASIVIVASSGFFDATAIQKVMHHYDGVTWIPLFSKVLKSILFYNEHFYFLVIHMAT
jgi:hypothetical protein